MALTKQQTALLIAGASQEFWHALSAFAGDCYYNVAEQYDEVCSTIANGEEFGTDLNDQEIDITGYPVRQRPPIRPSY